MHDWNMLILIIINAIVIWILNRLWFLLLNISRFNYFRYLIVSLSFVNLRIISLVSINVLIRIIFLKISWRFFIYKILCNPGTFVSRCLILLSMTHNFIKCSIHSILSITLIIFFRLRPFKSRIPIFLKIWISDLVALLPEINLCWLLWNIINMNLFDSIFFERIIRTNKTCRIS